MKYVVKSHAAPCPHCSGACPGDHCGESMLMKSDDLTSDKAKEILRDGTAQGHPLTPKQKRFFGWVAAGRQQPMKKSIKDHASAARYHGRLAKALREHGETELMNEELAKARRENILAKAMQEVGRATRVSTPSALPTNLPEFDRALVHQHLPGAPGPVRTIHRPNMTHADHMEMSRRHMTIARTYQSAGSHDDASSHFHAAGFHAAHAQMKAQVAGEGKGTGVSLQAKASGLPKKVVLRDPITPSATQIIGRVTRQ